MPDDESLPVQVPKHVRRSSRGVPGPVRHHGRHAPRIDAKLVWKVGKTDKTVEFTPQAGDEEFVARMDDFFLGKARPNAGVTVQMKGAWVNFGGMYLDQTDETRNELNRLRNILETEVTGLPGSIGISAGCGWRDLEIFGYPANPYHGSIWQLYLTPGYVMENQHEIVEYLRAHEDQILAEVQRLAPRTRGSVGQSVNFWEKYPGLHHLKFVTGANGNYNGVQFHSEKDGRMVYVPYSAAGGYGHRYAWQKKEQPVP
jgi:hypothetical protein